VHVDRLGDLPDDWRTALLYEVMAIASLQDTVWFGCRGTICEAG